jgi:hypothetical protein
LRGYVRILAFGARDAAAADTDIRMSFPLTTTFNVAAATREQI